MHRYGKRLWAWFKRYRQEQTEEDVFSRWEKDEELPPLSDHGLFEEYLELGRNMLMFFCATHVMFILVSSYTVWFHHHLCCCIPIGSIVCLAKQHC